MLRFYAKPFVEAAEGLQYLVTYYECREPNVVIETEEIEAVKDFLDRAEVQCKQVGLNITADLIEDAKFNISLRDVFPPTHNSVREAVESLQRAMHAELKVALFMAVPKDMVELYEKPALFGDDVSKNYQSAAYDISEAGKCLATNRSTACVLYLMRVLELGLGSLAKVFSVPFQHTNWNTIIGQIEFEIGKIDKAQNKPPNWRDDRKFYSTAANQFRFFKDSWRNYAMHIHDKYTPEEALIIYTSVKAFTEHIAAKLSE